MKPILWNWQGGDMYCSMIFNRCYNKISIGQTVSQIHITFLQHLKIRQRNCRKNFQGQNFSSLKAKPKRVIYFFQKFQKGMKDKITANLHIYSM